MGSNNGEEPSEPQSDITLIDAITMPIHNEHAQEWMPGTRPMLTPATHPTSTEMDVQEGSLPIITILPTFRQKIDAYEHVVRELNDAREWHFPFKPATAFKDAYNTLGCDDSGKQVTMKTVWDLVQALVGEDSDINHSVSRKMSLVIGARRHLEELYEKYILDKIKTDSTQAAPGEVVGKLQKIHAFLPIYICLRIGYHDEARNVALSSRASHQYAAQLAEWIFSGGMVSQETAAAATEECEEMLRMGDGTELTEIEKKKFLLYAIISGSRKQIEWLSKKSTYFSSWYDFLWVALSSVRDCSGGGVASSSDILDEGMVPYSLDCLQIYLNKVEPSKYSWDGLYPLVYPYVLLLSIQLLPAVEFLSKETEGDQGFDTDAVHILIALADHGVLSDGAKAASIIRQYGAGYLHSNNLSAALEYYVQAASAMGGGESSWTAGENIDQERQRQHMLKQLLTELMLCDGGTSLLLGELGAGKVGELSRFMFDETAHQFLFEVAGQCEDAGVKKRIHKYIPSIFGSSSTGSTRPGSKARAAQEWNSNRGRCLLCRGKSAVFKELHNYLHHMDKVHKKQYK